MEGFSIPGVGHCSYREEKRLWLTRLRLLKPGMSRKEPYDFYFKTELEARKFLIQAANDIQEGKPIICQKQTVGDFLKKWFDSYCVGIRDSTRMSYETAIFRHVGNHPISQMPLAKAGTDEWQEFFNYLNTAGRLDTDVPHGLSAKTQRNIYNMLHQAMELAKGQQLIWANPLDFVKLVKNEPKEVEFLTMTEIKTLLDASRGDPYRIGIVIGAFCGLRLGEICALTHEDVKFDADTDCHFIDVTRSLTRVKNYNQKPGESKTVLRIGSTKSRKSKREVPLLPLVAKEILTHMGRQREMLGDRSNIYLICNENGGFIDPGTWRKWLSETADKAGLQKHVHPHMLRHTFASHALRHGLEITEISQLLGHSDCAFSSRVYVHSDLEGRNHAVSKMSSFAEELLDISEKF